MITLSLFDEPIPVDERPVLLSRSCYPTPTKPTPISTQSKFSLPAAQVGDVPLSGDWAIRTEFKIVLEGTEIAVEVKPFGAHHVHFAFHGKAVSAATSAKYLSHFLINGQTRLYANPREAAEAIGRYHSDKNGAFKTAPLMDAVDED